MDSCSPPQVPEPAELMSLRVVVIDDKVDLGESMLSVLQLLGHDAYGATSGEDGVRLAEEKLPDLALIDVGMPGMSGFDVAAQIRRRTWGHAMILIALTGWRQEGDRRHSAQAGFDAHLVKPVDYGVLVDAVAGCRRG